MSILRILVRAFFRRVEVEGLGNVPASRGGLLVAWHPNGLIDPALILAQLPGRVVFGARHGLLHTPLLGRMMKALGTVPIYRARDHGGDDASRRAANTRSLDALAAEIAAGSLSALFPEGESHDAPHMMELKTGAARLYYRARQLQGGRDTRGGPDGDGPPPAIIPVGLHYDRKHAFRSRALVHFHPPIALPPELDVTPPATEPDETFRARARRLTEEIEKALELAVMPTESWEVHRLFHRARKLVRAERAARAGANPGRPRMLEKQVGFSRIWKGYRALRHSHPEDVEEVMDRVREYDADLAALRLEDHELDGDPRLGSSLLPIILIGQVLMVYVLLPPVLVLGIIVNLPAALLCLVLARKFARASKDEASIKVIMASILFPVTWIVTALLVTFGMVRLEAMFPGLPDAPVVAGLLTAGLSAIGLGVALSYRRLSHETMRALHVRFTRRMRAREIRRLRRERSALHDRLVSLAEGIDLPGVVTSDGCVVPSRRSEGDCA